MSTAQQLRRNRRAAEAFGSAAAAIGPIEPGMSLFLLTRGQFSMIDMGAIVLAPRTQNPIDNPYLKVRDAALQKFQMRSFRAVQADWLWMP